MLDEETVVKDEAAPETTAAPAEATTQEETTSQAEEFQEDDSQQEDTTDVTEESTETTEDAEVEAEAETPKRGGEARKEQLHNEIQDLLAQRNAIRNEIEQVNAQFYQPASVEELLQQENPDTGEYYNRLEAQLESMRQEREVERYNQRVSESLLTMKTEAQQALKDFPLFDETSPEYNKDVAAEVDAIVRELIEVDPNTNQIVGTKTSLYKIYQSYAKAAQANAIKAEVKAQKNVSKMLSNADPTPGGQGKSKTFEKMTLKEKESYLRAQGHDI